MTGAKGKRKGKKDQHGPRRPVFLPLDVWDRVRQMAVAHGRPIAWEVRLILTAAADQWQAGQPQQ